jgi:hypothetical protein
MSRGSSQRWAAFTPLLSLFLLSNIHCWCAGQSQSPVSPSSISLSFPLVLTSPLFLDLGSSVGSSQSLVGLSLSFDSFTTISRIVVQLTATNGTTVDLVSAYVLAGSPFSYLPSAASSSARYVTVTTLGAPSHLTAVDVELSALTSSTQSSSTGSSPLRPPTTSTGTLCYLSYSLPGTVDYPWSTSITAEVSYVSTPVTTAEGLAAVAILSGSGVRTFTNRFGDSFSVPFTLASATSSPLLYLNSDSSLDTAGLTLNLSSPVQLPGRGPSTLLSELALYNNSGVVVEDGSLGVDPMGVVFLSSIPGFVSRTIGASNINALAARYDICQAPISFVNGLRAPTQPTASNGAERFAYSYRISDGATYSVTCQLTVTATSGFATTTDQLGNPYQEVLSVVGNRTYVYLPTQASMTTEVVGLSKPGRFYPYALLDAAPGVYTTNTAPWLDYDGLELELSTPISANGAAPGTGVQSLTTTISLNSSPLNADGLLEEPSLYPPTALLQQQLYVLSL